MKVKGEKERENEEEEEENEKNLEEGCRRRKSGGRGGGLSARLSFYIGLNKLSKLNENDMSKFIWPCPFLPFPLIPYLFPPFPSLFTFSPLHILFFLLPFPSPSLYFISHSSNFFSVSFVLHLVHPHFQLSSYLQASFFLSSSLPLFPSPIFACRSFYELLHVVFSPCSPSLPAPTLVLSLLPLIRVPSHLFLSFS